MKLLKKIEVEHSLTRSIFGGALASYILSSLAHGIGPLVDGAVIGNFLGLDAVAAYGMMWPAFLICALFGAVIAGGTRNLYTSLVGQGKTDEANSVFTVAHVLNYILSTVIVLAVCILSSFNRFDLISSSIKPTLYKQSILYSQSSLLDIYKPSPSIL